MAGRLSGDAIVPLDRIALRLREAIVSTEDERFYDHHGIDPIAIRDSDMSPELVAAPMLGLPLAIPFSRTIYVVFMALCRRQVLLHAKNVAKIG